MKKYFFRYNTRFMVIHKNGKTSFCYGNYPKLKDFDYKF